MPRPQTRTFTPRQILAFDGIAVGGIVVIHALLPDQVSIWVRAMEIGLVGAAGAVTLGTWCYFAKKELDRESAAEPLPGDPAALESIRKENAENLRVIQQDLNNLGQAVMKRLAANAKPEGEHFEAIAGTVTDLAISLAEARETLAAIAADIAETKSVGFEMQAQIDQQADALHALEHALAGPRPAATGEPGDGAAPGSLGKALLAGASGAAVARLIGNGASRPESAAPEKVAPLGSSDIEGAYDSEGESIPSQDFAGDDLMEAEWEAPGEDYPELRDPLPDTFARVVAPETGAEPSSAEEPSGTVITGVNEDDYADSAPDAGAAGDLLSLAEEASTRRKPRRPGKNETAIIAHVMIGIGNKPYLRGVGPGLSPDKGVPMEYVDVGRWQWISPVPKAPATVSLWKNDEEPAEGDILEIPAGTTLEVHPWFRH